MDPTKCLEEIRELIQEAYSSNADGDTARELAEKTEALDNWMMTGGFMPHQWYEVRSDLPPATQPATLEE
jgi:hypothetical protein